MSHSDSVRHRTTDAPDPAPQKKSKDRGVAELEEGPPPQQKSAMPPQELVSHEALFHAIEGFVRSNCNFESSVPIEAALDEIGQSITLQDTFTIPLQRQLFNMDSALRWVLFLTIAPDRAEKEGDALFAPGSFSSQEALALISQVYDIGVQDAVWEHFEEDDEDDEDEEDTEEETEPPGE
jgi:hypothetical protein